MGLLAPLYIAGLLAIGLPILFHLIRRTPHGRQPFSSLMFLGTSPPRLTRRSRLTNILLLILRATALALLAFAFARPFFHKGADLDVSQSRGRRVGILVDTSASMRREDLWRQAVDHVHRVLKDVSPADEVGLFLFDRRVRPAFTFNEWNETEPSRRAEMLKSRLSQANLTWNATKLGEALASAADIMAETEGTSRENDKTVRQLVLISDVQQGGHVETLQGHQWPTNVLLEVRPVSPKGATNATVQWVKQSADDGSGKADGRLRVRVSSGAGAAKEQFTLTWADERGPLAGVPPANVYVPPGRNQMVRVPWPPRDKPADRLILGGDDFDFDNTLYVVAPQAQSLRVMFVGDDTAEDIKGLRYYLHGALGDTPTRKMEIVAKSASEAIGDADLLGARLVVVGGGVADDRLAALRRFVEVGGDVLWVIKDAAATPALAKMMGVEKVEATEATGDYALIGRVDFEHPLFAPFADARFGDFTKIHFWKHRKLKFANPSDVRVLAWFDKGDPFLVERAIGSGRLLVMASGWHPADSQLALSTKFVPLIHGLVRRKDGAEVETQYAVGEPIPLPAVTATVAQAPRSIRSPGGAQTDLPRDATTFDTADQPGIYKLIINAQETPLAVNLAPDESRTAPVAVEELERWGAKLGTKAPSGEELATREKRLRGIELENRQKVWRWLIVTVLGLLAVETALAGRLAHRNFEQQATP